jgi:hypothetical protein
MLVVVVVPLLQLMIRVEVGEPEAAGLGLVAPVVQLRERQIPAAVVAAAVIQILQSRAQVVALALLSLATPVHMMLPHQLQDRLPSPSVAVIVFIHGQVAAALPSEETHGTFCSTRQCK